MYGRRMRVFTSKGVVTFYGQAFKMGWICSKPNTRVNTFQLNRQNMLVWEYIVVYSFLYSSTLLL